MYYRSFITGAIAAILCAGMAAPHAAAQDEETIGFAEARPGFVPGSRVPAYYLVTVKRESYTLSREKEPPNLPRKETFQHIQLKVDGKYEAFNRLYFTWYRNDLIVVYEVIDNDAEEGASYVARIDLQSKNKKARWTKAIEGFNVGEPAIRGEELYVTAIGFVCKMDLGGKKDGEFLWKLDNLFDQKTEDFTMFRAPAFEGDKVIFYGMQPDRRVHKRLEVDNQTGKLLGIYDHQDK